MDVRFGGRTFYGRDLDIERSHYGATSHRGRSIAIAATVAVHLAVGALLLNHLADHDDTRAGALSGRGLNIFAVVEPHSSDAPAPAIQPLVARSRDIKSLETLAVQPALPTDPSSSGSISTAGTQSVQFSDPFAAAGLLGTGASPGADMATTPVIRSTLTDLDQQALAAVIRHLQEVLPDLTGTAILRCSVGADGRVADASFVGGSISDVAGRRLARMVVGRSLYPPAATVAIRIALIGPIILDPHFGVPS